MKSKEEEFVCESGPLGGEARLERSALPCLDWPSPSTRKAVVATAIHEEPAKAPLKLAFSQKDIGETRQGAAG